jgi:hypothetical protein
MEKGNDGMEDEDICSYYGELDKPLLGENLSSYVVDESYQRILKRHEEYLARKQEKIISEFKKSIKKDFIVFKNKLNEVEDKFVSFEIKMLIELKSIKDKLEFADFVNKQKNKVKNGKNRINK